MKKAIGLMLGVWMCLLASVNAAPKISGGFFYQFGPGNATVTISLDAITNPSEDGTGPIKVQLWAMPSQYDGGRMNGHSVASFELDGLDGDGSQYSRLKKTLRTSMPARPGNYHMCITVSEYRGDTYYITDNRNLSRVVALAPAARPAPAKVNLSGGWSWKKDIENGTITMRVGKITNNKAGKSGSLRLAVWATPRPYVPGTRLSNGYQLGSVDKKALEKGYSYSDVVNTTRYKRPPSGTYHTALFLLEFNGEEYVIVSHLPASDTSSF